MRWLRAFVTPPACTPRSVTSQPTTGPGEVRNQGGIEGKPKIAQVTLIKCHRNRTG